MTILARALFTVTTILTSLLAAGLASQAAAFPRQDDLVSVLSETAWNTSAYLSQASLARRSLAESRGPRPPLSHKIAGPISAAPP